MHKIIEELRSTNSRIEKESILKREYEEDNIYLSYIFASLAPFAFDRVKGNDLIMQ